MSQQQKQGPKQLSIQQKCQIRQQLSDNNKQVMKAPQQKASIFVDHTQKYEVEMIQEIKPIKKQQNPFLVKPSLNHVFQKTVNLFSLTSDSQASTPFKNLFTSDLAKQKENKQVIKDPIKSADLNLFSPQSLNNIETNALLAIKETNDKIKRLQMQQNLLQLFKYTINQQEEQSKEQKQKKPSHPLFYIYPSFLELSTFPIEKLEKINGFKLWNNFGQLAFLEEISLIDLKLQKIIMVQDKIQILSDQMSIKKKRFVYRNYLNYSNLCYKQKQFLKKQISLQMQRKKMRIMYHSQHNGDLIVY